jgi:hypothetical protein
VLYAVNSDFDLQYNGGTIQSYDLSGIRRDAVRIIANPTGRDPGNPNDVPLVRPNDLTSDQCPSSPPVFKNDGSGGVEPLGQTCAPPVKSQPYFRSGVVIGAFATDLLLSDAPTVGSRSTDRLFVPVRGNASLTWATVNRDSIGRGDPFHLDCDQGGDNRCLATHQAGTDPNEEGNNRHITMPGEPFGIAVSEDGEALVMTHQSDTKTSLFSTGLTQRDNDGDNIPRPSLSFVLDGVPVGGIGITTVPHDPDALDRGTPLPNPAFLETTRAVAEIDLLRRFPDDGSSLQRPFLNREIAFPILPSAGGTDSRGIVIDPTQRIACKSRVAKNDSAALQACARRPARVFVANRTPPALLIGDIGATAEDGTYDPDKLTLHSSIPLSAGPSNLYLAPIVDTDGSFALRIFVVCFDSATIFVYDPDSFALENVIRVGPGPFAMTFDPFTLDEVANHAPVQGGEETVTTTHDGVPRPVTLRRYRFAYVASFTQSFVELLDLDNAAKDRDESGSATFERIVFTLGNPTNPKGT